MNEPNAELKIRLRLLVGNQITLRATTYTIIEVLENPLAIVLKAAQLCTQADAHGNARRHVKQTIAIPVLDNDGKLHEDFVALKGL